MPTTFPTSLCHLRQHGECSCQGRCQQIVQRLENHRSPGLTISQIVMRTFVIPSIVIVGSALAMNEADKAFKAQDLRCQEWCHKPAKSQEIVSLRGMK